MESKLSQIETGTISTNHSRSITTDPTQTPPASIPPSSASSSPTSVISDVSLNQESCLRPFNCPINKPHLEAELDSHLEVMNLSNNQAHTRLDSVDQALCNDTNNSKLSTNNEPCREVSANTAHPFPNQTDPAICKAASDVFFNQYSRFESARNYLCQKLTNCLLGSASLLIFLLPHVDNLLAFCIELIARTGNCGHPVYRRIDQFWFNLDKLKQHHLTDPGSRSSKHRCTADQFVCLLDSSNILHIALQHIHSPPFEDAYFINLLDNITSTTNCPIQTSSSSLTGESKMVDLTPELRDLLTLLTCSSTSTSPSTSVGQSIHQSRQCPVDNIRKRKLAHNFSPKLDKLTTDTSRRRRTRLTDHHLCILRSHFDISSSPSDEKLTEICHQTGLSLKVVKHWFRNTLFKERQRSKDNPYNFANPPTTVLNLTEYERTGKVEVSPTQEYASTSVNTVLVRSQEEERKSPMRDSSSMKDNWLIGTVIKQSESGTGSISRCSSVLPLSAKIHGSTDGHLNGTDHYISLHREQDGDRCCIMMSNSIEAGKKRAFKDIEHPSELESIQNSNECPQPSKKEQKVSISDSTQNTVRLAHLGHTNASSPNCLDRSEWSVNPCVPMQLTDSPTWSIQPQFSHKSSDMLPSLIHRFQDLFSELSIFQPKPETSSDLSGNSDRPICQDLPLDLSLTKLPINGTTVCVVSTARTPDSETFTVSPDEGAFKTNPHSPRSLASTNILDFFRAVAQPFGPVYAPNNSTSRCSKLPPLDSTTPARSTAPAIDLQLPAPGPSPDGAPGPGVGTANFAGLQTRRNRTSITSLQSKFMTEIYRHYKTPSVTECQQVGAPIGLNRRVVQVWFQNQRAKEKKYARNNVNNDTSCNATAPDVTGTGSPVDSVGLGRKAAPPPAVYLDVRTGERPACHLCVVKLGPKAPASCRGPAVETGSAVKHGQEFDSNATGIPPPANSARSWLIEHLFSSMHLDNLLCWCSGSATARLPADGWYAMVGRRDKLAKS